MHFVEKYYNNVIKQEYLNKFICTKTGEIPKLKKIILNFGCKTADIKQLSASLLAFELIINQSGRMTKTKRSNILFKIRKGNPTGCKLTLSKLNIFQFLSKMTMNIFPKLKNFSFFNNSKKVKVNSFSYKLTETFCFYELEKHYYLFNTLPSLDVTIVTNAKTKNGMIFLIKALKIPLNNK